MNGFLTVLENLDVGAILQIIIVNNRATIEATGIEININKNGLANKNGLTNCAFTSKCTINPNPTVTK